MARETARFGYLGDPLWLAAVGIYLVNRLCIRPRTDAVFFHGHLNGLLLIPINIAATNGAQ